VRAPRLINRHPARDDRSDRQAVPEHEGQVDREDHRRQIVPAEGRRDDQPKHLPDRTTREAVHSG